MIEIKEMDDNYILDWCPLYAPLDPLNPPDYNLPPHMGERAKEIRRAFFRDVRGKFGNCVLFAWDDGNIVGFLIYLPKTVARQLGLYILPDDGLADSTIVYACMDLSPDYRQKGAGTLLVNALIQWVRDNGWHRIEVNDISIGDTDWGWQWKWGLPKWHKMGFRLVQEQSPYSVVLDI